MLQSLKQIIFGAAHTELISIFVYHLLIIKLTKLVLGWTGGWLRAAAACNNSSNALLAEVLFSTVGFDAEDFLRIERPPPIGFRLAIICKGVSGASV
jgi:hypothetical protein